MHEDGFLLPDQVQCLLGKGLMAYGYSTWVLAPDRCGDYNCYGRQDVR